MGLVTSRTAISLDGFTAGPNQSLENPVGEGGHRLHEWIFGTECKMPVGGPENVQKIQQQFVASYKGKSANLSETYTNDFADKAS